MHFFRRGVILCVAALASFMPALAQVNGPQERPPAVTQDTIDQLRNQLVALEARIKDLEGRLAESSGRNSPTLPNTQVTTDRAIDGSTPVTAISSVAAAPPMSAPIAGASPEPGAQEM